MIPQIIYLALLAMGIGLVAKLKGKEEKNSFISKFIAIMLTQGLFYWGGFYNQVGWPQLIMFIYVLFSIGICVYKNGTTTVNKGLSFVTLFATIAQATLLYYGGFFKPILNLF